MSGAANGNGAAPPTAQAQPVSLTGIQVAACGSVLIGAQANQMLALQAPPSMVVDALLGVAAGVIAGMSDVERHATVAAVLQNFPGTVTAIELAKRRTAGGVIVPRATDLPAGNG